MCARFQLTATPKEIAEYFSIAVELELLPRLNIAPTQPVLVLRPGGGAMMKWGLTPAWAEADQGAKLINLRSETVFSKFKVQAERQRCLIPATGFYEWRSMAPSLFDDIPPPDKGPRQPVLFTAGGLFAFAGVWDRWNGQESCALLTTEPNALVAPVHDRMPCLLSQRDAEIWLDPDASQDELLALATPFETSAMEARPVNSTLYDSRREPSRLLFCEPE